MMITIHYCHNILSHATLHGGANPKSLGAARSNVEPPLHQSLVKVMQGIAKSQLNIPNTELFLIPPPDMAQMTKAIITQ